MILISFGNIFWNIHNESCDWAGVQWRQLASKLTWGIILKPRQVINNQKMCLRRFLAMSHENLILKSFDSWLWLQVADESFLMVSLLTPLRQCSRIPRRKIWEVNWQRWTWRQQLAVLWQKARCSIRRQMDSARNVNVAVESISSAYSLWLRRRIIETRRNPVITRRRTWIWCCCEMRRIMIRIGNFPIATRLRTFIRR